MNKKQVRNCQKSDNCTLNEPCAADNIAYRTRVYVEGLAMTYIERVLNETQ